MVTQCPKPEEGTAFELQGHEPLAFLSGAFRGAPSRWPIIEKEGFAIVETVTRLEYLLMRPGGRIHHIHGS